MTDTTEQSHILVAVDSSPQSDAAVRWAAHEAALRHLPVRLAHVVVPVTVSWPVASFAADYSKWQEDNAQHAINQARNVLSAHLGQIETTAPETEVLYGYAVPTLVGASKDASMLVVGSRGIGAFGRAVIGSTSSGLVHHAHCPVVIVHSDQEPSADRTLPVLLGVDGSEASEAATAFAFDEASHRGVDLVALHAWSDVGIFPLLGGDWHRYEDEGHEVLGERLAGWQERYPDVNVHRRIVCDLPARWLIEESRRAQLVVVGSHGRGGFAGMLLGSVSTAVAESANAPVVVVRH
jgi:nucleotide-binding universal stress UspA family protein